MCEIRIGTSGWQYKHWRGPFYAAKASPAQMFAHYIERFDTVEINNSFYRLPKPETFAAWRDAVPPNFRFAVKGSRFITHNKKLKDPEPALERLMPAVDTLKRKLGPILFQLPPKWHVNTERLKAFLEALPRGHRYAFEFRNETWNTREVFDLLRKHNAAYCIFHLAGFQSPLEITANFAYVRLHGPGGKYQGSYDDATLQEWARRIREWGKTLKAVYVYFDNDEAGYAAQDALRLRGMLLY